MSTMPNVVDAEIGADRIAVAANSGEIGPLMADNSDRITLQSAHNTIVDEVSELRELTKRLAIIVQKMQDRIDELEKCTRTDVGIGKILKVTKK